MVITSSRFNIISQTAHQTSAHKQIWQGVPCSVCPKEIFWSELEIIVILRYNWNPLLEFPTTLISFQNLENWDPNNLATKEWRFWKLWSLCPHENQVTRSPSLIPLSHLQVFSNLHNCDHETISILLFSNLSEGEEKDPVENWVTYFLGSKYSHLRLLTSHLLSNKLICCHTQTKPGWRSSNCTHQK